MYISKLFVLFVYIECALSNNYYINYLDVINDFIVSQERPASVVSFVKQSHNKSVQGLKSWGKCTMKIRENIDEFDKEDHSLFIVDLKQRKAKQILLQAYKNQLLRVPKRWILFYSPGNDTNQNTDNNISNEVFENIHDIVTMNRDALESILDGIYIGINTEVYIAVVYYNHHYFYSVYRISPKSHLIWDQYGIWSKKGKFISNNSKMTMPMKRRNLKLLRVGAISVVTQNYTFQDFEDYLHREIDTMTKFNYHMVKHLFDWVNGTGVINITESWGYKQADGKYDGMVRELEEGRADVSGSPFIATKDRLSVVEYVAYIAPMKAYFVFRKPALASVTNIFVLPFSCEVWIAVLALIGLCSVALFFTSYREQDFVKNHRSKSVIERMSDGLHDTLCLVFQQGTAQDPISVSTRQILVLGLLSFMFLFTAYSANVIALLQTTTNEINNVDALRRSPLKMGIQEAVYTKYFFPRDTRPAHVALWKSKLLPQGDRAYITTEEGIRRVRKGMYAFHVEMTAGYDQIQRTFLENEKCNIGEVNFLDTTYPFSSVSANSHIKEQLKIGIRRVIESGLQSRSTRRVMAARPSCGASVAMFSTVTIGDVAPAFKFLLIVFTIATCILILEIIVYSRKFFLPLRDDVEDYPLGKLGLGMQGVKRVREVSRGRARLQEGARFLKDYEWKRECSRRF